MVSAGLPALGVLVEVSASSGALGTDRTMLALAAQDVLPKTVWLLAASDPSRRVGEQLVARWRQWLPELVLIDAPPVPNGVDAAAWLGPQDVPYPFYVAELATLLQPPSVAAALTGCFEASYDTDGVLRRRDPPSWPPSDPAGLGSLPAEAWRFAARTRWLAGRPLADGADVVQLAQRRPDALRLSHRSSAERRRFVEG
jgi:hypothetical protein